VNLPVPPGRVTPDNAEFHDGLGEGRLLLPRCDSCATVIWYPRHHCPACGSNEVSWFQASGRGTVYSFTIVRRGPPPFDGSGPYVLAYVELEEGPRVLTNILADPAEVQMDARVEAVIDRAEDAPPLLRFRLSGRGR
jgi:uncharacterized OB-fold protein